MASTGTFHKYLGTIPAGLRPSQVNDRARYVFAVPMRDMSGKASFKVKGISEKAVTDIIGSDRKIEVSGGKFQDDLQGCEVKLYRIR